MTPHLLFAALDFYLHPARFAQFRDPSRPLPEGITELLAVPTVSLSPENRAATEAALGCGSDEILNAVRFFARQALLELEADHYRTLGVPRDASAERIRQHYHYLIRLFHPDRDVKGEGWDELYAPRINEAWQVLRSAERRAAYDQTLANRYDFGAQVVARSSIPAAAPPCGSRLPRGAGKQASLASRRRWYTSPWPYAAMVAVPVGVMLIVFFNRPAERLTIAAQPVAGEAPVPAKRPGPPPANSSKPEPVEDRREQAELQTIEDVVAARVQAATVAVLGAPRQITSASAAAHLPTDDSEPAIAVFKSDAHPLDRASYENASTLDSGTQGAPTPEVAPGAVPAEPQVVVRAQERPSPAVAPVQPTETATAPVVTSAVVAATEMSAPTPGLANGTAGIAVRTVEPVSASAAVATAIAQPEPDPVITDDELDQLMANLSSSYERLDAIAYAALFSKNARTTDARGRKAIEQSYRSFFSELQSSRFETAGMNWSPPGETREGSGTIRVRNHYIGAADPTVASFTMRFVVQREASGVRIQRMDYQ